MRDAVLAPGAAAVSTAVARPDLALVRSVIAPPVHLVKGTLGEAVMCNELTQHLNWTGNWQLIPAQGKKGIDASFVKMDSRGNPRALLVAEAKYGKSRLGQTKDGLQMSKPWVNKRLVAMGNRYMTLAGKLRAGGISIQTMPKGAGRVQVMVVPLRDGQQATFWRRDSLDSWKLDTQGASQLDVGKQAEKLGRYVEAHGQGILKPRRLIYRVEIQGERIALKVTNLHNLEDASRLPQLPQREFSLPLSMGRKAALRQVAREHVEELLHRELPSLTRQELSQYSDTMTSDINQLLSLERRSMAAQITKTGLITGGVTAAIPLVFAGGEWLFEGADVRWGDAMKESALLGTSAASGVFIGEGTVVILTRNAYLHQLAIRASESLGMSSSSVLTNSVGSVSGGAAASLVFAYGGYFMGMYDLRTANRMAMAGSAVALAGAGAYAGTVTLVAIFGTASTGTAISTLSGAAATDATLAWLGGGSLASGGFGVAGGSLVATGGTAIIAIAATFVVMEGFHLVDEHEDSKRLGMMLGMLGSDGYLGNVKNPSFHNTGQ